MRAAPLVMAVVVMLLGRSGAETGQKRCSGDPGWWSCPQGECCASVHQPDPSSPSHSLCLPCQALGTSCAPLWHLEHRLNRTLRHRLPSIRHYLLQLGLLDKSRADLCHAFACNTPANHSSPIRKTDGNHYCWHHSPLNRFFPGNHLLAYAALLKCPADNHCCASVRLPDARVWAIGCTPCPSFIDPNPPPNVAPHEEIPGLWSDQSIVCPSKPAASNLTIQPSIHADRQSIIRNRSNDTEPYFNTTVQPFNATRHHIASNPIIPGAMNRTTARSKPVNGSLRLRPASPPVLPSTPRPKPTKPVKRCPQTSCSNPSECCAQIGSSESNDNIYQFCLPCNLILKTAVAQDSGEEVGKKCARVGAWERASMVSLRPLLPSIHTYLSQQKSLSAVKSCQGSGCNRPHGYPDPGSRAPPGHWCWNRGPFSRFFPGNKDGSQAVISECGRYQHCCSFVYVGTTHWPIGCVQCESGSNAAFEEDWRRGEISPWGSNVQLCGWLKPEFTPASGPIYGGYSESVCHAQGVEPHFNWPCPAEAACCLTVGSITSPFLPRLPSCIPCHLAIQPYNQFPNHVSAAEPLCQPMERWYAAVGSRIRDHIPTLSAFFRDHDWVLRGSTVSVCRGDACNIPPGFETPDHPSEKGIWCWHHSPMSKFFAGNEGGNKALLARCNGGEKCCTSMKLFNGEVWALGCYHCQPGDVGTSSAAAFIAKKPSADALSPSPWTNDTTEACTWRPTHRCHILQLPGAASFASKSAAQPFKAECPSTQCCFTAKVGDRVVGQGCAPCALVDTCQPWGRHLVEAVGRRAEGRPLVDLFWPPPRQELGTEQSICVCRGSLCNVEEAPPTPKVESSGSASSAAVAWTGEEEGSSPSQAPSKPRLTSFEAKLVFKAKLLRASAQRLLIMRRTKGKPDPKVSKGTLVGGLDAAALASPAAAPLLALAPLIFSPLLLAL